MTTVADDGILVTLESSGGIAGPMRRPTARLGSAGLSADDSAELERLIDASRFFDLPANFPTDAKARDPMTYSLTIERNGRRHTVTWSDGSGHPHELAELASWVQRHRLRP